MNFEERLALGKQICAEVKAEVICSNDIIPTTELPVVLEKDIEAVKARYKEKGEEYFRYFKQLESYRSILFDPKKRAALGEGAGMIQALSLAYLGLGECQEVAALAIAKLLCRGIKECALVGVKGINPGEVGRMYTHAFVLLTKTTECPVGVPSSFDALKALPDNIVVVDPFLNHVGRANRYHVDLETYCRIFKFTSFFLANYFDDTRFLAIMDRTTKTAKEYSRSFRLEHYKPSLAHTIATRASESAGAGKELTLFGSSAGRETLATATAGTEETLEAAGAAHGGAGATAKK